MTDASDIVGRKIIGARIKRTEDPRLLTGVGSYTDDRPVARLLHDHTSGRSDHAHRLWCLLVLELWQREYVDSAPHAAVAA